MTQKDEALKMAIEALKDACGLTPRDAHFCKAINACKEALAEPKREWRGLSDEKIATIWMNEQIPMTGLKFKQVYIAIEQALKEKNHG